MNAEERRKDEAVRKQLGELVELCFTFDTPPHFVLLSPPKLKWGPQGWLKNRPSKEDCLHHLQTEGNRLGLIPSSLNLGVFDYDGNCPTELESWIKKVKPICVMRTSGGGHRRHLITQLTSTEINKVSKTRKPDSTSWDWICEDNYCLIHDYDIGAFISAAEKTQGMLAAEESDRNLASIVAKPKTKKKKKEPREDGEDSQDFDPHGKIDRDNPVGEKLSSGKILDNEDSVAQRVEHIFQMLGYDLPYHKHKKKLHRKRIEDRDDLTNMGEYLDKPKSMSARDAAHKLFRMRGNKGKFVKIPKFTISEWESALEKIKDSNECDFLKDWLIKNSKDYSEVSEKVAKERIDGRLYEIFDIIDVKEEYAIHGSMLPYFTLVLRRFHPGIPVAQHLAIFGDSRSGKSTFTRYFLPQGFSDYVVPKLSLRKEVDKLVYELAGMAIAELNEMGDVRSAEVNHVKALLADGKIWARWVYEKSATMTLLTHATIGTANLDERPLPNDPVASSRFVVVPIKKREHQEGADGVGYIESLMLKDQNELLAYVVHLCKKWKLISEDPVENRAMKENAQSFIQDILPRLKDYHMEHVAQFQYNPRENTSSVEDCISEWLFGVSTAAISDAKVSQGGKKYFTGKQINEGVKEFREAKQRGKANILRDYGFRYQKLRFGKDQSGKPIRQEVWVLPKEVEDRQKAIYDATIAPDQSSQAPSSDQNGNGGTVIPVDFSSGKTPPLNKPSDNPDSGIPK